MLKIMLPLLVSASAMALPAPTYTKTTVTHSHAKGLVRTARGQEFLKTAPRMSFVKATTPVPSTYSLRGKAGAVEDQGQCGSCWDFSLTTALRGTWILAGKDPGRLSFNYLLNCDQNAMGCNGGDFTAAQMFVTPQGAPAYGSDGTYTAMDGSCQPAPAVASTKSFNVLGNTLTQNPSAPTPSFQDIAYAVGVLHLPVVVDVAADLEWQSYTGGVYNGCDSESADSIDHMVTVEGYDCETSVDKNGNCVFDSNGNLPAGVGTWLIRNSWGTAWGDSGYITTKATDPQGQRCNAVAFDALYYDLN